MYRIYIFVHIYYHGDVADGRAARYGLVVDEDFRVKGVGFTV